MVIYFSLDVKTLYVTYSTQFLTLFNRIESDTKFLKEYYLLALNSDISINILKRIVSPFEEKKIEKRYFTASLRRHRIILAHFPCIIKAFCV